MTQISDMFANQQTDQSKLEGTGNDEGLMFIGEGKKYANEEEADKAIAFKEDHISKIETENARLRELADKAKTIDDVLNRIQDQRTESKESYTQTENKDQTQQLDIDALVAQALDAKLDLREQESSQRTNSKSVFDELTSKYGERAGEVYAAKGQQLGIDLDNLSATSPKAVLEFFKEPASRTVGSYMGGNTQNTASLTNSTSSAHGTYEYWNKQLRSGKLSREKCFQEQHKSLQALGAAKFYGSNS